MVSAVGSNLDTAVHIRVSVFLPEKVLEKVARVTP